MNEKTLLFFERYARETTLQEMHTDPVYITAKDLIKRFQEAGYVRPKRLRRKEVG